jgi:hypothetical protein
MTVLVIIILLISAPNVKAACSLSRKLSFKQLLSRYLRMLRCSIEIQADFCIAFKRNARVQKAKTAITSVYRIKIRRLIFRLADPLKHFETLCMIQDACRHAQRSTRAHVWAIDAPPSPRTFNPKANLHFQMCRQSRFERPVCGRGQGGRAQFLNPSGRLTRRWRRKVFVGKSLPEWRQQETKPARRDRKAQLRARRP